MGKVFLPCPFFISPLGKAIFKRIKKNEFKFGVSRGGGVVLRLINLKLKQKENGKELLGSQN